MNIIKNSAPPSKVDNIANFLDVKNIQLVFFI